MIKYVKICWLKIAGTFLFKNKKKYRRKAIESLELWMLYFIEVRFSKSYKIQKKQLVMAVNKTRHVNFLKGQMVLISKF